MLSTTGLLLAAYLIGSIPSGYLLVRALRGLDVRNYGSHNVGAINVFRVGGVWLGVLTLLADAGKALGVVLLAAALAPTAWAVAGAALLVMIGHAYSAWLFLWERRFSEGKSVASGLGVLAGLGCIGALPWHVMGVPVVVWMSGLLGPRLLAGRWAQISLATMSATVSVPVSVSAAHVPMPYLALSGAMAALILVRHKNNIRRLRAGTEPRLGDRVPLRCRAA
jgi:glycerol-3-phosphate acyltransferase PlsY